MGIGEQSVWVNTGPGARSFGTGFGSIRFRLVRLDVRRTLFGSCFGSRGMRFCLRDVSVRG